MPRHVLIAVPDLFFLARIEAAATLAGTSLERCASAELTARCAARRPDLVILDLHAGGDPLAGVRALKAAAELASIPVVGFYSHVEQDTRRLAQQAGVDQVLPRSAFTSRLAELLAGGA